MKAVSAMVVLQAMVLFLPGLSRAADIPAESARLHANLSGRIQPSVRSWIDMEANKLRGLPAVDESRLRADIAARFKGQKLSGNDIEVVAFLVMMRVARDADSDLKAQTEQIRAQNEAKRRMRESAERQKNARQKLGEDPAGTKTVGTTAPMKTRTVPDNAGRPLDSASEMDEMTSMRLQMMMDRRSKCIETLSNIMKKISSTQDTLVQNLK